MHPRCGLGFPKFSNSKTGGPVWVLYVQPRTRVGWGRSWAAYLSNLETSRRCLHVQPKIITLKGSSLEIGNQWSSGVPSFQSSSKSQTLTFGGLVENPLVGNKLVLTAKQNAPKYCSTCALTAPHLLLAAQGVVPYATQPNARGAFLSWLLWCDWISPIHSRSASRLKST